MGGVTDGNDFLKRFLNRYILVQEEDDSGTSQSGWQTDVVCDLYAAVLGADLSLRDTFAIFDRDGDGRGNPSSSLKALFPDASRGLIQAAACAQSPSRSS